MKVLVLLLGVVLVCVVLFVVGVIAPARSRRMQRSVGRLSRKGEDKSDRNGGRLGDANRKMLEKMRHAADASAQKGRHVNERLTPDSGDAEDTHEHERGFAS